MLQPLTLPIELIKFLLFQSALTPLFNFVMAGSLKKLIGFVFRASVVVKVAFGKKTQCLSCTLRPKARDIEGQNDAK